MHPQSVELTCILSPRTLRDRRKGHHPSEPLRRSIRYRYVELLTMLRHSIRADILLGIPLLWFAAPISTFFWLVGSSGCVIGAHAGLMEPGIES